MSFNIGFSDHFDGDVCEGSISLGKRNETFHAGLNTFSRSDYVRQWESALKTVLVERRTTALFYNVDIGQNGVGTLWLYPMIPSEWAGDTESKRARLRNFPECDDAGVYICERFVNVTVDPLNFEQRFFEEFEDGSQGEELALYFLDLACPERIFGYLDDNVADVSHWYFSNADLEAFLSSKK